MTLEEAIRHYEESEKINKELAENCVSAMAKNHNLESAEKCRQMIEWLTEFAERRKQPEIIRCKDCVDWGTNDCAMFQTVDYDPDNDWTNPDGYCHMAERRTDDKTNKGSSC